jgi:AraC-like DNA-binding protein
MTTSPRSSLLVVHFLEPLLASLEERLERPLGLAEFLSLETPMGRSFARYVQFVWDELRQDSVFMASALALRELEDSLASALLTFAEPELGERPTTLPAARSATLTRAEEYIRANLQKPLSVLEIAGATGVAPRTVTRAFRMHRGLGPSAFVRKLRLEAAHRDLLAGSSDDIKVCDVALKYGFNHLGRFAGDYRRLHGERPSDTLRRG